MTAKWAALFHDMQYRDPKTCLLLFIGALARGDAAINMRFPRPGYREKIWDHAAGALIVQEAGAVITDASGLCPSHSKREDSPRFLRTTSFWTVRDDTGALQRSSSKSCCLSM